MRLKTLKQHWEHRRRRRAARARAEHPLGVSHIVQALQDLGIRKGETLFAHVSLNGMATFVDEPFALIQGLRNLIGRDGTLLMPSFPLAGSMEDHLAAGEVFDVRTTPSRMGLVTEIFRRLPGVMRSVHPTHSVAAIGREADGCVCDHHRDETAWGPQSPFERVAALRGKIVLFGATLAVCTHVHVAESRLRGEFPVDVFREEPVVAPCLDAQGREIDVTCVPIRREWSFYRDPNVFGPLLARRGVIRSKQIDPFTRISLVDAASLVETLCAEARRGKTIYRKTPLRRVLGMIRSSLPKHAAS